MEIVACTSSGEEALTLTTTLAPDVVLVDVQLGHEDGLELAERFQTQADSTRVILISTHSGYELTELIDASPAIGFLPKTRLSASAIAALLA
jgi:DNA-binding NarL/FixJ family response regulator